MSDEMEKLETVAGQNMENASEKEQGIEANINMSEEMNGYENQQPVETKAVVTENVEMNTNTVQNAEVNAAAAENVAPANVQPDAVGTDVQPSTTEIGQNGTTVQYQDFPLNNETTQTPAKVRKQRKKKEKTKKQGGSFIMKVLACASLGIVFGVCGGLGFFAVVKTTGIELGKQAPEVIETQQKLPETTVLAGNGAASPNVVYTGDEVKVITSDVSDMVEQVMPGMVSIVNNYTATTSFWGHSYSQDAKASGSGIIVGRNDEELIMVTNHHVVADATKLEVTFIDGETAEAQIKGSDPDMDLAVIAVAIDELDAQTLDAITVVKMGDSDSVRLGSPVIAIGNALGYGQSVTGGYLSAVNREITFDDGMTGKFLQTDAAINPGNSGGALLNLQGELIGINSSKIGGDSIDGIGFAIPISNAKPILEELMAKQTKHKNASGKSGYLGIEPVSINDDVAYMYNYPKGVYVRNVEENSPAAEGGMLIGDIITKLDGDKITSYEDLAEALTYHEPGSSISVVVQRLNGGYFEEVELIIVLGERPEQ